MKIKLSQLKKIIREAINESPPTRRGLAVTQGFDPHADDFDSDVKTQRGMALDSTVDSMLAAWDKHMGREPVAASRRDFSDADGEIESSHSCENCGAKLSPHESECPDCTGWDFSGPQTKRSPGVSEMKLSLMSGGMGNRDINMDDLFLMPDEEFKRDTAADEYENMRIGYDVDVDDEEDI